MIEWLTRYTYAHRGLHADPATAPENSLAAFEAAASAGYGIELDVQAAACGTPVIFHDFTLKRLTEHDAPVGTLPAKKLSELVLAGSKQTIPTLARTLDLIAGRVPLLLEIKVPDRGHIGPLEAEIALLLENYGGPVAVQSFNPQCVAWFAENAPEFVRGQIAQNFISTPVRGMCWQQRLAWTKLWDSDISLPHFVSYRFADLPNPMTRAVRQAGIPLITWTVRSAEDARKSRHFSDSFIFEGFRA